MKNRAVFVVTLIAFVPAVLAMLPIAGLHYGAPAGGSSLPAVEASKK